MRKVNKCSKCGTPGHKATTCPKPGQPRPVAAKSNGRRNRQPALARTADTVPAIAGASAPSPATSDLITNAREKAGAFVRQKLEEELAWAEAYVAELKRVGGIA